MGCEDGPSDDGEARGVRLEISHKEMDLSGILWKHSSKKPLEDGVGPRTKRKLNLLAGGKNGFSYNNRNVRRG